VESEEGSDAGMENLIIWVVVLGAMGLPLMIWGGLVYLNRSRFSAKIQSLEPLLDIDSVRLWPGPLLKGSFHGRDAQIYRRLEYPGGTRYINGNGMVFFDLRCSSPLEFTIAKIPTLGIFASFLRSIYPPISCGDHDLDKVFGFIAPYPNLFKPWVTQPVNKKAILSIMSMMPVSPTHVFRIKAGAGLLSLVVPQYLFHKMELETLRSALEKLDDLAMMLEQGSV
jgi:hypothetical protein